VQDQTIKVKGLAEVSKAIRRIDSEAAKQLRLVGNDAADLVITGTRAVMPHRTGAAQASLKAQSTRTSARVRIGGRKAPYEPWLDFGGQGRHKGRPAARPFIPGGRYLFPTVERESAAIGKLLQDGIVLVAKNAGLAVD
jgi:hypothetical protein